ncbi:SAM-dependent methyltransferase [Neptunicella sp.]|uniref:SAM-dependent methyltransferase n=1 Tax=Neptunicella sp. TaxID=2125986 RepID=UPI003F690120
MLTPNSLGSIVVVSTGMTLGAHLTPRCRSYLEHADIIFGSNPALVEQWISEINPNYHSLQGLYAEGKHRQITYREMVDTMLAAVREGKKVVGAFYGHAGVFAWAPHRVIKEASAEGYSAHMEAGVSAEDCLYADLNIDPGRVGCQHFETSQLMMYQRRIDPSAYLILWQVGLAGDTTIKRFSTGEAYRQILVDILSEYYPPDHQVALYECPFTALDDVRIDWLALKDLPRADISPITTLVVPPSEKMVKNQQILDRLAELDLQSQQL